MNYLEWEKQVPSEIRDDVLWKVEAYRLGLFAADLAWADVLKPSRDRRMLRTADQLYGAVGGVSATIAEGFSRTTGKERARFYEYALGSSRESRDWYFKARHVLGDEVSTHRIDLMTQNIRLLLTMIPDQRRGNQRLS